MGGSLDPAANIYEGFWTNWSKGRFWGYTWTLCPEQATLLTNSMALFTTIAGIQLWTVVRYIIHHFGAYRPPEMSTPHHNQQQFILRNGGTDLTTGRLMLTLALTGRRSTGARSLRSFIIGILALVYAFLFMIAGVYSNKAISDSSSTRGSEVLSRSEHCGIWNETYISIVDPGPLFTNEDELELWIQFKAKKAYNVQLSLEYAQECYLSQTATDYMSSTCNTLKTSRLNWDTRAGSCPFAMELCHRGANTIVLDTRYIDTHEDLGINASPSDRLKYRRVTTCTVLNDTNYVSGWNGTVLRDSVTPVVPDAAHAFYGPSLYKNTNWTYSYSNFASFYDNFTSQVTTPYQLDIEQAMAPDELGSTFSDFDPIPELAQTKADLVLLFLGFAGTYSGKVDDPWFSAQSARQFETDLEFLDTRYARDRAISTLGCTEQHQFCRNNHTCTDLLGFDQVQNNASFNDALTPHQNATFDRIIRAVAVSRMRDLIENLAVTTNPMLASNGTASGGSGQWISQPLSSNQWKIELNYWHSIAMSQLQRGVVQWATGQIAPEPQFVKYLFKPTLERDRWFCQNLIIPSMIYQSFRVVPIILIISFGTTFIIASFSIETLAGVVRKCLRQSAPKHNWDHDDMLRARRLAFGFGGSSRSSPEDLAHGANGEDIPIEESVALREFSSARERHRISSQVLPPDDIAFLFLNDRLEPQDFHHDVEPTQLQRPRRDSWTAISLTNLDFEPFGIHVYPSEHRGERRTQS